MTCCIEKTKYYLHTSRARETRTSLNLVTNQDLGSGFVIFLGEAKDLQIDFVNNDTHCRKQTAHDLP